MLDSPYISSLLYLCIHARARVCVRAHACVFVCVRQKFRSHDLLCLSPVYAVDQISSWPRVLPALPLQAATAGLDSCWQFLLRSSHLHCKHVTI